MYQLFLEKIDVIRNSDNNDNNDDEAHFSLNGYANSKN